MTDDRSGDCRTLIEQWAWDEALRVCYDDGQSPHARTALALQTAYRRGLDKSTGGSTATGPAQRPDSGAHQTDLVDLLNKLLRYRIDHEYYCGTTHGKEHPCDCGLAQLLRQLDAATQAPFFEKLRRALESEEETD